MLQQLEEYCTYLLEYNKHTNLTAIREKEEVYLKHFYDSLTLVKAVDFSKINTFVDIGSGAGFPGIVLKIFYPHLCGTLIDSNNKKTTFLENLVDNLGLINIEIVNDRVENFSPTHLNSFDLVTARAVTNMPVLTELALPLVKVDGLFVAMKAKSDEELASAMDAIELMGGSFIDVEKFILKDNGGERSLIKIKKIRNTIMKELRSYDKIIKKPLQKHGK
ncbi:MAG: 16S rRNA (guanine(527)-N(7))-methyltransferase RsmG [Bacilli bacterium]|nr:16S rRNA (guanine(527)-N(7))-methyltransferase RsmG [Bacilli bacterium]